MSHAGARAAIAIAMTEFVGVLVMGDISFSNVAVVPSIREAAAPAQSTRGRRGEASTRLSYRRNAWASMLLPLAHRGIDVQIFPWMFPVGVLLVTHHPWLQQRAFDRIDAEPPWI